MELEDIDFMAGMQELEPQQENEDPLNLDKEDVVLEEILNEKDQN